MLKKKISSWASDVYFQGVAVNDVPFPGETAAGLDVPGVIFNGTQRHVLWDLGRRHAVLHVLLVGEDQHGRFAQVLERKDGWTWNKNKKKEEGPDGLPRGPTSCRVPLWWWPDALDRCCPPPGWQTAQTTSNKPRELTKSLAKSKQKGTKDAAGVKRQAPPSKRVPSFSAAVRCQK